MPSKKTFNILWITDPWNTLDHPNETTIRLAEEALRLGHKNYWCNVKTIHLLHDRVYLHAQEILKIGPGRHSQEIQMGKIETLEPKDFSSLQYRPDPPVNLKYIHPIQLLNLGIQGTRTKLINPPEVLSLLNEKFSGAALKNLMPETLVACEWETLLEFGKKEKITVLKPLYEAQSKGIELLDWRSKEGIERAKESVDILSEGFKQPVLLQKFLEKIKEGEVRIFYIDGKILGVVKKLPLSGDFRINIDRGSTVQPYTLSKKEKKTAGLIGKHLKKSKIRLAAIDLIDGYLTDYNFTSPGLLVQMEQILKKNLAKSVIQTLANNT